MLIFWNFPLYCASVYADKTANLLRIFSKTVFLCRSKTFVNVPGVQEGDLHDFCYWDSGTWLATNWFPDEVEAYIQTTNFFAVNMYFCGRQKVLGRADALKDLLRTVIMQVVMKYFPASTLEKCNCILWNNSSLKIFGNVYLSIMKNTTIIVCIKSGVFLINQYVSFNNAFL